MPTVGAVAIRCYKLFKEVVKWLKELTLKKTKVIVLNNLAEFAKCAIKKWAKGLQG